jgi:molybdenum cofactor cytidylyltransferase
MGLAGVILAAGESTRMGRNKALLPWPPGAKGHGTILSVAITALGNHCDLVIVVAGKNEVEIQRVVFGCGAFLVRNAAPERGQFSSLQTGLREVLNRGRDNAMITLVDRPPAEAETLSSLVNAFAGRDHGVWAIVPEYHGKHGHPILIGREMMEAFLQAPASANAREIEHASQQRIIYVATEDPLVSVNVDTPEDYARIRL